MQNKLAGGDACVPGQGVVGISHGNFHFFKLLFFKLFICSGVGVLVGFLHLLEGGVCINLGGAEGGMSEQGLYGANVGTVVEHGGGESVSEHVGGVFLEGADLAHARAHDAVDIVLRQGFYLLLAALFQE